MAAYGLLVAPHWRPQVGDVVRTLLDAPDGMVRVVPLPVGILRLAAGRVEALGVLVSDDARPALFNRTFRGERRPHTFRLWWNTGDEITGHLASGAGTGETHICFFEDQRPAVEPGAGTAVVVAPYAFSSPVSRPPAPARAGVGFAAEVDTSDRCFAGVVPGGVVEELSARIWELAHAVVEGALSLVGADAELADELRTAGREGVHRTALWSLRNRVRYLLVEGLVAAFPGRFELRGSDWAALGFDALPTKFRRWRRLDQFAEQRVAVDLGSKSTHSWLYPRTADILAAGGGLAQFESGAPTTSLLPGLERRRAGSLSGLTSVIEDMLSMSDEDLAAENAALHDEYRRLRAAVGHQLGATMAEHR